MGMEGLFDSGGHVSVRLPNTDRILIHPRQVSRAEVTPDQVVTLDLEGRLLEGELEPPSETALHTAIYRARPDVLAVAHLHSHYATTLSIAERPLVPVSTPAAIFAPQVPVYDDPALIHSQAQGDAVAQVLGQGRAVLLRGHGSVVVGESLEAVLAAAIHLEDNARKLFHAHLLGQPRVIGPEEAARLAAATWQEKPIRKVWLHYLAKAKALGVLS
jgi:L-fuculose-phosphate aldolase